MGACKDGETLIRTLNVYTDDKYLSIDPIIVDKVVVEEILRGTYR